MVTEHKCGQEARFDKIDDKLEKIDEKLDSKLEKINENLSEHMKRTALLEERQANHDKVIQEVTGYAKKLFFFLIAVIIMILFKDNSSMMELIKMFLGAG